MTTFGIQFPSRVTKMLMKLGLRLPSRLHAFTRTLSDALVPDSGSCVSVQGELIRANDRLQGEYFRNGLTNYFGRDEPDGTLAGNYYGELLLFVLETMIANRNQPLANDDVAYFSEIRRDVEPQWLRGLRSDELFHKGEEEDLSPAEKEELASLDAQPRGPDWESFFRRAERCIASWCLSNTALIDRQGEPVTERGVSAVMHVFHPPPAPPPCPLCNGKGWLSPKTASDFPAVCSCKK
jgi:hypothetical protein